ncbi:MAG: hypothetical protein H6828_01785 [Planctomycetes bacterium]|nr:hypothetical protein [Planctomycetota bacterium]
MSKPLLLALVLAAATSAAHADLQQGDLVLVYPGSGSSSVQGYGPGGVVSQTITGNESSWIAATRLPDGRLAVHNNSGTRQIHVFEPNGTLFTSFPVSTSFYASDIDAYADGSIALCSRFDGILVYDPLSGALLSTLLPSGMIAPMGCQVQSDQTLWVADLMNYPGNPDGMVWHLDVAGNVLHSFATPWDASDVAVAGDGTVWVIGREGEVLHCQPDGTVLNQWTAVIGSTLTSTWSLAVDDSGVVWISGHYDTFVRGYDAAGNVVQVFDTTIAGNSTYSFIVDAGQGYARYCFGDGTSGPCPCGNDATAETGCTNSTGLGAELRGFGAASLTTDSLNFQGSGLAPNQPALLFSADNRVAQGSPGFLFGDGFRCAGGSVKRLGVTPANAAGAASWGPGLAPAGGWSAGDTRRFQAWYRDPQGSPCGSFFNLSNGVEVVFVP